MFDTLMKLDKDREVLDFCADKFLKHVLEISVPKVKIAMLFRLEFLEGKKDMSYLKNIL